MSEEIKHRPVMTGSDSTSGVRLARLADAIDLLEADVAAVQAKVGQVAPEHVRHFVEQRDAAIRERDEVSRKLDEARALLKLTHVQRTAAYADRDEARAEVYRLKCSMTETSKDRDAAIRERDEARAEVERLKNELYDRVQEILSLRADTVERYEPHAAPQPAAPPPGWLTEEERNWLHKLLSYLRSCNSPNGLKTVEGILARSGSPPVVEVPAISRRDVPMQNEAFAYRAAMDRAGVKWKEVGRE